MNDLAQLDPTSTEAIAAFNKYAERIEGEVNSPLPAEDDQEAGGQEQRDPEQGESTTQGRSRDAHRARINRLDLNNPLSSSLPSSSQRKQPDRAPPEMTFEITRLDFSPLGDLYKDAAHLLGTARRAEDQLRPVGWSLKFNSRKLRSGDWIVWALDQGTLAWLESFFNSENFAPYYKATIVASRGQLVKYSVGITAPDSMVYNYEEVLTELFKDIPQMGYVRFFDEQKRYKDEEDIKGQKEAKKNKEEFEGTGDYDKMIWVRMSQSAHQVVMRNEHLLGIWMGVGCLDVTRLTDLPGETPMMGRRRKLGPRPENEALMAELRERALEGTGDAPLAIENLRPEASISMIFLVRDGEEENYGDGEDNDTINSGDDDNDEDDNRNMETNQEDMNQAEFAGNDEGAAGTGINEPTQE